MKYTRYLVCHEDEGPNAVLVPVPDDSALHKAVCIAIYGEEGTSVVNEVETLLEDNWIRFEGDASLQLLNAAFPEKEST